MVTLYLVCAVVGGTVLLCQFVLTLIGIGGESADDFGGHAGGAEVGHHFGDHVADHTGDGHDHGHGHGSSWFFGVLSLRTLVAALTFFGLVGMATSSSRMASEMGLGLAVVAGLAAMYVVHWMMLALHKLHAEGTVNVQRAIGKTGTVYLAIPGHKAGTGKVTLAIQKRTMEYQAMTAQDAIPTGARVIVVDVIGSDTVEVEMAADAASESQEETR